MSETDFLKLKKHDNVETNTEKFDIENYLNGNWDKIDENVGEVNTEISNINSKSTELEKELKEAQEDFYQNSIRGQASGEYIHVEDSSNCRARIGIGGNHEQETSTQGKNYFTGNKVDGGTNLGVTYSFDNSIFKLNGTSTGSGVVLEKVSTKVVLPAGNYKYRTSLYSGSFERNSKDIAAYLMTKDGYLTGNYATSGITLTTIGNTYTFTLTENTELYVKIFVNGEGLVLNNTQLAILIAKAEKDENIGAFEQFIPNMPSPDYQSPVKTVGSNVNLIEETFEGYNINGNGAFEKANGFDMQIAKLKANVKYTLNANTYVFGYYNEKPTIASITYDKSRVVLSQSLNTITPTRDGYISFRTDKTDNNKKIKLVEGTEVGEYSKYGQGCVKVTKCNKNFLKNTAVSGELNGVNRTVKEDGSVIINGTSTKWANLTVGTIQGDGNSYILSGSPSNSEIFLTVNNTEEGDIAQSKNGSDAAFIPLKGSTYSVIVCIPSKKTFNNEVVKPLIRTVNDEDNTYIKHQEQSYIMPVQQEMLEGDYFDYDNEEEVHIFGKKVLTGNENWEAIGTNASGKYRFQTKVDDIVFNADGDTYLEGICDSYKVGTPNTTYLCQESIATVQYYLIIYNEKVNDTVENFKKGLSNKNVTIYYKLATPIRLKFTDEQKAVAKELNNARTYKNVTNITTDSIAILDLDYAKDLEELTEYSTEERVIGRWIDGKPLYSKVGSIKFTSVYDSSGLHTRGSLIDSDIDYGTVSKVLNKNLLSSSLFNTYGTSTSNVYVENRQGNSNKGYILGFTDRTDLLNTTIYVVVEYTKTTD